MQMAGTTHRGSNAITKIGLVVASEQSLIYWKERLDQYDVPHGEITTYGNRPALHFEDPDRLRLVFVVEENDTLDGWEAWEKSNVLTEQQNRGVGTDDIKISRFDKIIRSYTYFF